MLIHPLRITITITKSCLYGSEKGIKEQVLKIELIRY